jgi:DNA-binding beta-propeller fold protein YncE
MRASIRRILSLIALALLTPVSPLAGQTSSQYCFLREIAIGGVVGLPSLALDPDGRRLYVTHSSKIEIVNLDTAEAVATISNAPAVRGFAVAPKLRRGFFSNSRDGCASMLDLTTLTTTAKIKAGAGTVAMLYEPGREEVYAFNTRAMSATVFDAASGVVAATIPLPAKPGAAAADPGVGRVYCNFFARNEVAAINAKTHQLSRTWPVAPGKEPAGIAVDPANHRLFIGCRNKILLMLDGLTGKVIASVPIGAGVDATAFDPSTRLVFCANSDGTTTIAREDAPDKLGVVQKLQTEKNARLMALDPKTHKIYLATTDFEAQLDPDPGAPKPRPRTLQDSFKILVYGPAP